MSGFKKIVSEDDSIQLTNLIMGLGTVEDSKIQSEFPRPMKNNFNQIREKHLFEAKNLSAEILPPKSILIKSEKRNIGKTLLLQSWKELLASEQNKILDNRETYQDEFGEWSAKNYLNELYKYSYRFVCERDISAHYFSFENGSFDFDLDFNRVPRYFFLDDFCYENSYNFDSGKVTDRNFINFMRKLLEWLCINKDKIIVIATTNNSPSRILSGGNDSFKSSLATRYEEIFTSDNKINGVEIK